MSLFQMIEELMVRSGRALTVRDVKGGLRVMFAVRIRQSELRRFFFANQGSFGRRRDSYQIDQNARDERLVAELMAA